MVRWIPGRTAAAGILLFSAACLPAELRAPEPTVGPTATATPTASPVVIPSPAPSPTLIPTPSLPPLTDLGGLLRPLATGWHPAGETAILQQPGGLDGSLLVAVPLDGTAPSGLPLVAFGQSVGWDVRPDGAAFAIALATGLGSSRVAIWDAQTGGTRWVSPDEPGVLHSTPVWSADGGAVHYAALRPPEGAGIFRVPAAGGRPVRIRPPEGGGAQLHGLTPDGRDLVWSRADARGSTLVLDLESGETRSFGEELSRPLAWRSDRPRALVVTGGCCAGRTGTLVVWDDLGDERRAIYGSDLTPQEAVGNADWSPDGRRIVATVYDTTISSEIARPLVTMNESAGERLTIEGTEGAGFVRWVRAGILYVTGTDTGGAELWLVRPGGAPESLFRGGYLGEWRVIGP